MVYLISIKLFANFFLFFDLGSFIPPNNQGNYLMNFIFLSYDQLILRFRLSVGFQNQIEKLRFFISDNFYQQPQGQMKTLNYF